VTSPQQRDGGPPTRGVSSRCKSAASGFAEKASLATRTQGALTIAVIALFPVYVLLGWLTSIPALAVVTLLTWIDGRINSWIGARIARKQHEDADVKEVLDAVKGS
jgi:hypothetical protein